MHQGATTSGNRNRIRVSLVHGRKWRANPAFPASLLISSGSIRKKRYQSCVFTPSLCVLLDSRNMRSTQAPKTVSQDRRAKLKGFAATLCRLPPVFCLRRVHIKSYHHTQRTLTSWITVQTKISTLKRPQGGIPSRIQQPTVLLPDGRR